MSYYWLVTPWSVHALLNPVSDTWLDAMEERCPLYVMMTDCLPSQDSDEEAP